MNYKQVLAILAAVLGVLMVSTSQLTDLFGAGMAKGIVGIASMATTMINSILAVVTGQAAQVRDVLAMPGVESMQVNRQANSTLAAIAVDPTQGKISATAQDASAVNKIATGEV